MTLIWTFSFLHLDATKEGPPQIMKTFSFQDGKPTIAEPIDKYLILLHYIAFFPDKDFSKIKLGLGEHSSQYLVHFLDKRFLSNKYLCIFTVNEFNVAEPFEYWGFDETMAEYIFEYTQDVLKTSDSVEAGWSDIGAFLEIQVADFYIDWSNAKNTYDQQRSHQARSGLASTFSQIIASQAAAPKPRFEWPSKKEKESTLDVVKPLANPSFLHTPTENSIQRIEQWWDIQLINEFGFPLTDLLSFIEDESFRFDDEMQKISQNLESMSISALKIMLEQQAGNWAIRFLKLRLPNEMGFQYIFFNTFTIQKVNYLLIMNCANFDTQDQLCLQIIHGNEVFILDKITTELLANENLFTPEGKLVRIDDQSKLESLIITAAKKAFVAKM